MNVNVEESRQINNEQRAQRGAVSPALCCESSRLDFDARSVLEDWFYIRNVNMFPWLNFLNNLVIEFWINFS